MKWWRVEVCGIPQMRETFFNYDTLVIGLAICLKRCNLESIKIKYDNWVRYKLVWVSLSFPQQFTHFIEDSFFLYTHVKNLWELWGNSPFWIHFPKSDRWGAVVIKKYEYLLKPHYLTKLWVYKTHKNGEAVLNIFVFRVLAFTFKNNFTKLNTFKILNTSSFIYFCFGFLKPYNI